MIIVFWIGIKKKKKNFKTRSFKIRRQPTSKMIIVFKDEILKPQNREAAKVSKKKKKKKKGREKKRHQKTF